MQKPLAQPVHETRAELRARLAKLTGQHDYWADLEPGETNKRLVRHYNKLRNKMSVDELEDAVDRVEGWLADLGCDK